jgi:hypothetical protein
MFVQRKNQKLMSMRNYCAGYYDESTSKLNFWIQAEARIGQVGTKGYLIDVPKLVFGSVGEKLHSQDVKQHFLNALPQQQHSPYSNEKQHQKAHSVGGFVRPSQLSY